MAALNLLMTGGQVMGVIARSHQATYANGFWDHERNFGEILALVHSEMSEAYDAWSLAGTKYDEHLPQFNNWEVEFADTYLRVADVLGAYSRDYWRDTETDLPIKAAEAATAEDGKTVFRVEGLTQPNIVRQLADAIFYLAGHAGLKERLETEILAAFTVQPKCDIWSATELYEFSRKHFRNRMSRLSSAAVFLDVHRAISRVLEIDRKADKPLGNGHMVLELLLLLAVVEAAYNSAWRQTGVYATLHSFHDIIKAKSEYNKTRGRKHGKNY